VLLALAALLAAALFVRASGVLRTGPTDRSLPPLLGVAAVAPGLLRGGEPSDAEMMRLRDDYGVRAVVDVDGMDVEERAVTRALGLRTHELLLTDRRPPTAGDIQGLLRFLRAAPVGQPDGSGGVVYLHDLDGRGPVLVVAAILQLLRGDPLETVLDAVDAPGGRGLPAAHVLALSEVDRALRGVPPANAYWSLRGRTW
jgi:hypothetical protein